MLQRREFDIAPDVGSLPVTESVSTVCTCPSEMLEGCHEITAEKSCMRVLEEPNDGLRVADEPERCTNDVVCLLQIARCCSLGRRVFSAGWRNPDDVEITWWVGSNNWPPYV